MLTNNITRFLTQENIPFVVHSLQTTEKKSAMEVAQMLNKPPQVIFKTIVLTTSPTNKAILALVPADCQVNLKTVALNLNEKKVTITAQSEAERITGLQVGGISPLALCNKPFRVIIDQTINSLDSVIISAGLRGWQIELTPADLITLTRATVAPIAQLTDTN
jgi:Cys-tRNA(Pro)/Cys-tRNA(Cys) deacylase